jgi:hypothetical protein
VAAGGKHTAGAGATHTQVGSAATGLAVPDAAVPSPPPARRLAVRTGVIAAAAAVLFFCYWRQSQLAPVSSDGSANILQAWDMLHGNLLLSHWWVSDVSFYTTELPQYMLIEAVGGIGTWVVHVGAAMTYTVLVLLAALLAKGHATGRAGLARALLAGGLMLAPQLMATSVVLLSPDHTGTAVPLLVTWLLIDRARPVLAPGGRRPSPGGTHPPGPPSGIPPRTGGLPVPPCPPGSPALRARAWFVPVLVCLLFTFTMVADSIVLLTGIVPLMLACAVRACPGLIRRGKRPCWYELSLAAAAAVAGIVGSFAPRAIAALGGYQQRHVGLATDLGQLRHGAWVTVQAFLELFGADLFGVSAKSAGEVVFVALHLAGALVVAYAVVLAFGRFFRAGELMVPVFAVAVALNLVAYMISTHALELGGDREVAAVLPLGAVLAGRLLGERVLARARAARSWFVPVLAVLAAGYLAALGYNAAQASAPAENQSLAAWLVAHRLTSGLAGYWQANSTTVDSRRQVVLSAVTYGNHGRLVPDQWETDDANYDPAGHYADFVVAGGFGALPGMQTRAELTFGRPARIYHADGYTVMVWDTNLLDKLGRPGPS